MRLERRRPPSPPSQTSSTPRSAPPPRWGRTPRHHRAGARPQCPRRAVLQARRPRGRYQACGRDREGLRRRPRPPGDTRQLRRSPGCRARHGARGRLPDVRAPTPGRALGHPIRRRGSSPAQRAPRARGRPRGRHLCRRGIPASRARPPQSPRTYALRQEAAPDSSGTCHPGSVSKTGAQWWKSDWCAGKSSVSEPSGSR